MPSDGPAKVAITTAPPPVPASGAGPSGDVPRAVHALMFVRDRGILLLWMLLVAGFGVWCRPFFATTGNALLIADAAALTAIYAAGVAVGVMSGALDLSIPGTAAMAGVIAGWLLTHGQPVWLALPAGVAVGVAVGLVTGLVSIRGCNTIIVTIGTLSVLSGLAAVVAGGYTIPGLDALTFLGTRRYAGVPAPVYVVLVLFLVLTLFLTRTRGGIRLMAVGGNAEAVRRCGIHSDRYKVAGFVVSGLCAAVGGLVSAAVVTEASPEASPGIIFSALTAVALAGVALSGGRGSLPRVLVGALILATISNGLTLKGVQPYWGTTVTGALLLGSLVLDRAVSSAVSARLIASAGLSVHSAKE